MAAAYPAAIRTFTIKKNVTDINFSEHINDLQEELTATQRILGINPHGSYTDVISRLNGVDTSLANKAAASHTHAGTGGSAYASVPLDGSIAMTGLLTLPAQNPTNANHAARKLYVDSKGVAGEGNKGWASRQTYGTANAWSTIHSITIDKKLAGSAIYIFWSFSGFLDEGAGASYSLGAYGWMQHRVLCEGISSGTRNHGVNGRGFHVTMTGTATLNGLGAGSHTVNLQINPANAQFGWDADQYDQANILALES